jgi:hypothetical protein
MSGFLLNNMQQQAQLDLLLHLCSTQANQHSSCAVCGMGAQRPLLQWHDWAYHCLPLRHKGHIEHIHIELSQICDIGRLSLVACGNGAQLMCEAAGG